MWEEKAANQARFSKGRVSGGRKTCSKREQGYVEPPVIVFSDVENPDDLRPPDLTHGQVAAAAALVSAVLEAQKDSDPTWRAIIGVHTNWQLPCYELCDTRAHSSSLPGFVVRPSRENAGPGKAEAPLRLRW